MSPKLNKIKLIYRKLKISDYEEFNKLFYLCFGKKISLDFFKWRYFNDKFSFCYGVFNSKKLIANVGMISMKLHNITNERVYSRHSSMVLKKFRGIGIFSELLKRVKKIISSKVNLIIMWPNENNFANFDINQENIIKKKFYLYKNSIKKIVLNKTKNHSMNKILKLNKFIKNDNNFFLKNYPYFKKRYLDYKKKEYFINEFNLKNFKSFFILKRNKDKSVSNYVILDHFGSNEICSKHLSHLTKNQNRLIFLSKKKIYNSNFKLINYVNFKIGLINKINFKQKKKLLYNKEIFLGDTDIFITTY